MMQEHSGDTLGPTSVHVNRTLKTLEGGGLISRNHRKVRFPDWQRLQDLAGFNDTYLHFGRQAAAAA